MIFKMGRRVSRILQITYVLSIYTVMYIVMKGKRNLNSKGGNVYITPTIMKIFQNAYVMLSGE